MFTKNGIWRFRHDIATLSPHSHFNKQRLTISVDIRIKSNEPDVSRGHSQPAGRVLRTSTRIDGGRWDSAPAKRRRGLAALVLSLCFVFLASGAALAETRTLKLYYIHTKERAEITYKRNGKFIPAGLNEINRFLRDWRRNEPTKMDPRVIDLLWQVYRSAGGRDYIHVVSAYRSPATNSMLRSRSKGVAEKSQHMLGKAIDFYIPGVRLATLRAAALKFEGGGVGYYPSSGSPFVHIDVGNARHWPRMNRSELMALFPDGKTVHVPSDGKPLPGFKQALAAYESRRKSGASIQLASASSTPRRGFLATLFGGGGGADDEEDSSTVQVAAAPAQRPAAARPTAVQQAAAREPEARPERPQAIAAALPARAVPLPGVAPRPSVDVGTPLPVGAAQPAAPEPAAAQTAVALNIPIPTRRPNYTPPVAAPVPEEKPVQVAAADSGQIAAQLAGVPVRGTDVMADMADMAGSKTAPTEPSATLAAYLPVSSDRPAGEAEFMMAALQQQGPAYEKIGGASSAGDAAREMADVRLARLAAAPSASPRLALIAREAGLDPISVVASGPKTTSKAAKPVASDSRPDPRSIPIPVPQKVARWALSNEPVRLDTRGTRAPSFAHAVVRSAPDMVYTAGFQAPAADEDPNHFRGKAVVFLSVARFKTN